MYALRTQYPGLKGQFVRLEEQGFRTFTTSVSEASRFATIAALLAALQARTKRSTICNELEIVRLIEKPGEGRVAEVPLAQALTEGLPVVIKRMNPCAIHEFICPGSSVADTPRVGNLKDAQRFASVSDASRRLAEFVSAYPDDQPCNFVGVRTIAAPATFDVVVVQ